MKIDTLIESLDTKEQTQTREIEGQSQAPEEYTDIPQARAKQGEKTATCPKCGNGYFLEPRETPGCHEMQCPQCFQDGFCVILHVDGRPLATKDTLPLPGEHAMADFRERAAIRQYDGIQSRADAERGALHDLGYL